VDSGVLPEHALRVGVVALDRTGPVNLAHAPLTRPRSFEADDRRGPALPALRLAETPAPEVVGARDDARPDRLGDPHLVHEPADLGVDLEEAVGPYPEPRRVFRMEPQGIGVGDLVEPLRVAGASVNQRWQPEGRQEQELVLL